jgi:transposase InsO family protein
VDADEGSFAAALPWGVERRYGLEGLQIKRRRRKKIPVSERQPLIRPGGPNEVWSMDFVFDRVAGGNDQRGAPKVRSSLEHGDVSTTSEDPRRIWAG